MGWQILLTGLLTIGLLTMRFSYGKRKQQPLGGAKTVDARHQWRVTGEPLAGVPLMGGVPMPTPATRKATMRPVVRFSGTGAALPLPPEQKVLRGHTLRTRGAKGNGRQ